MLGPQQPQSRREGRSLTLSLVSSITPSHHSQDLPLGSGPLDEAPPFNVPCHVLPCSPLVLIEEHSLITGFAPLSVSWWQPTLVMYPEPSIQGNWGEFVNQLNVYFGQPNLAQASECTLCTLKM